MLGKWVLQSSNGLGGGWAVDAKGMGAYRQSRSVGLKGSEMPEGNLLESMAELCIAVAAAALTGGSCGSCMLGSNFI